MPLQLHMVWPKYLALIPDQNISSEYSVRCLRDGDESAYVRLMHAAGFVNWTEAQLATWRRSLALPDGIFVAVHASSGEIVATALAAHRPTELHPSGGELGWVAASTQHAGHGLGMAVSLAALRRLLDAGYHTIYLLTDDHRLAAIKIYLKIGFLPFLCATDMKHRWETVAEKLNWRMKPDTWLQAPQEQWVQEPPTDRPDSDRVHSLVFRRL